ncbi:hypothetical protein KAR91_44710 [Candidatus Pacearchaeota archaeon]|nr:hypothetical protein [Candidatus Pacearchaeota archaeon]
MVKLELIGCNYTKACGNPGGCCSTCFIGFANCEWESEQCNEVPDTCDDEFKIFIPLRK